MDLYSVSGTSGDNVFAVGRARLEPYIDGRIVLHYDGASWTRIREQEDSWLYDVWVHSGAHVLAVGRGTYFEMGPPPVYDSYPIVMQYDGRSWTTARYGHFRKHLFSVWCASETDAYASGLDGLFMRYDGDSWSDVEIGTTVSLNALHGTGDEDVFVAGDHGTILHYRGP